MVRDRSGRIILRASLLFIGVAFLATVGEAAPVCGNGIGYWTGWADDNWTNPENWACRDGTPAGAVPGLADQANLLEIDRSRRTFKGFAKIHAGDRVVIHRLEWRAGGVVAPDAVGLTVEGTLKTKSAAFGNNSIASTLTIPAGGEVDFVPRADVFRRV